MIQLDYSNSCWDKTGFLCGVHLKKSTNKPFFSLHHLNGTEVKKWLRQCAHSQMWVVSFGWTRQRWTDILWSVSVKNSFILISKRKQMPPNKDGCSCSMNELCWPWSSDSLSFSSQDIFLLNFFSCIEAQVEVILLGLYALRQFCVCD